MEGPMTVAELNRLAAEEELKRILRVEFNARTNVIEIRQKRGNKWYWIYEIDMDRCRNARQALEWIRQVSEKVWADTDLVYDLSNIMLHRMNLNNQHGI